MEKIETRSNHLCSIANGRNSVVENEIGTPQTEASPKVSRRKFLTTAATGTTGAAIAGFPMIAVAESSIVPKMQGAWGAKDD